MSEAFDETDAITEKQKESITEKPSQQILKHIREKINEKMFFWYDLVARSQDYAQVMELNEKDLEDLFVSQSEKTKEGFCYILVDNKKVIFTIVCDIAANYGIASDDSDSHWRMHFIIMAYYPENPELNKSNGVKEPWIKKRRRRRNYDEEEDEEDAEQWTTIVCSEKLHLDILKVFEDLKKES
jgi:hypothetical protein